MKKECAYTRKVLSNYLHGHLFKLEQMRVELAGHAHHIRPVEAGQRLGMALAGGGIHEDRAQQGQRQAQAAEDDEFPGGFE